MFTHKFVYVRILTSRSSLSFSVKASFPKQDVADNKETEIAAGRAADPHYDSKLLEDAHRKNAKAMVKAKLASVMESRDKFDTFME